MSRTYTVWHFAGATLRDRSPLPEPGFIAPEIANPVPCKRGYHGSKSIYDALQYAAGPNLCQRELDSDALTHGNPVDKLCASMFMQLTPYTDVSDLLVRFARHCALLALRVDAPKALRSVGLNKHADRLAELPDDCDMLAAGDAARAAAGDAGAAAGDAAWAAAGDAGAARRKELETWLLRALRKDA